MLLTPQRLLQDFARFAQLLVFLAALRSRAAR
jgi:hypothetical protein